MSILNFFKRNNNKNSNFSAKDVENLFIKAIEENYVDEAIYLVKNYNAPIDITYHNMPLLTACIKNHKFNLAKFLIKSGANTDDVLTPTFCRKVIENEDVLLLDFLIDELHIDINKLNDLGHPPLITAIINNKNKIIHQLLKRNTLDLNKETISGYTALEFALINNNYSLCKTLLSRGAKITNNCSDLLNFVIKNKDLKFIKCIAESDNNQSFLLDYWYSLLEEAIIKNDLWLVKYFVSNGANVNTSYKMGDTPVILAIKTGNIELVKYLVSSGANINSQNNYSKSPLIFAIESQNLSFIKELIDMGADVNTSYNNGTTPLMLATTKKDLALVKYFIKMGSNINAKNDTGTCALSIAIEQQDMPIINYLLSCNINTDIYHNSTLLHIAIKKKNLALTNCFVKYFIKEELSINKVDKNGNTPLLLACKLKDSASKEDSAIMKKIIDTLIGNNAKVNIENSFGETPLTTAIESKDLDLVVKLIRAGAIINPNKPKLKLPLICAFKTKNTDIIKTLINNKAKINIETSTGESPLTAAIESEDFDLVVELISAGAIVNPENSKSKSPLMCAFKTKNIDIIRCLIDNDAFLNKEYIIDNERTTPLIEAVKIGNFNLVEELINKGAKVNFLTKDKKSPLGAAKKYKQSDIKHYLISKGAKCFFWERLISAIVMIKINFKNKFFRIKKKNLRRSKRKYNINTKDNIELKNLSHKKCLALSKT
ncbi:MAG: ankyrin repeat domain-containing protein [Clostridiales bacterium]|nr:ankyrin repeat domain-containing protein [Clostridiales bacterium]